MQDVPIYTSQQGFTIHRNGTEDTASILLALFSGHFDCVGLRIEAVEFFKDITLLRPENFTCRYAAKEELQPSLSAFPRFLDTILKKKTFHIITGWSNYVKWQIGQEVDLVKNLMTRPKKIGSSPTQHYLMSIYQYTVLFQLQFSFVTTTKND